MYLPFLSSSRLVAHKASRHCIVDIFFLTKSNVVNFLFFKARDENFKANFTQYGLGSYFVDVLVADAGRLGLREAPLFDAIITDRE